VTATESSQRTTIKCEQKFFTAVEGSYFRKSEHTSEPVFVMNLGGEEFDMADGQTGEIISVLKNIGTQKDYIRSVRNSVYRRFVAWDELLRGWEREPGRMTETVPDLLRKTYQFLAPRYMQTDDWLLASQVQGNQEDLKEQVW